MRRPSVCGLAIAVAVSLAACGGGGDPVSWRVSTLGEILELTGLSAPAETAVARYRPPAGAHREAPWKEDA